jgi:ATP-dependent Clp protease ATP-binding subunit ClpX
MDNAHAAGSQTDVGPDNQRSDRNAVDRYLERIAGGDGMLAERFRCTFRWLVEGATSIHDLVHNLAVVPSGKAFLRNAGPAEAGLNQPLAERFCRHQYHCLLMDDQHSSIAADTEYLATIASWPSPAGEADEALLLRVLLIDYTVSCWSLSHYERWRVWTALPTLSMYQLRKLEVTAIEEAEGWVSLTEEHAQIDKGKYSARAVAKRPLFLASARALHVPGAVAPCDSHGALMPANIERQMAAVVVGQDEAVRSLALSGHLHQVALTGRTAPPAGPLLLAGPTGSGKTLAVKTLAGTLDLPFVHVDCSSLVTEGIVGATVAGIFLQMLHQAGQDFDAAETGVVFLDEFDKLYGTYYGRPVQMQLLRAIEGAAVQISTSQRDGFAAPARPVFKTGRLLFILGGSWQACREEAAAAIGFGTGLGAQAIRETDMRIPPELQGRIRRIVHMRPLGRDILRRIAGMQGGVLHRSTALLNEHGHRVIVSTGFLDAVVDEALQSGTGARGIDRAVMARLESTIFDLLGRPPQRVHLCADGPTIAPAGNGGTP